MIATDVLVKKVRRLVNEAEDDSNVSLITDDLRSLDDTILELLPQAVALVQNNSHGGYVNVKSLSPDERAIVRCNDDYACVALPDDFVKLVSLQLSSWKKPCLQISSSESPEVMSAINAASCIGAYTPVCAEGVDEYGKKIVKLFPHDNADVVSHFVYEAHFDKAEGLMLCDNNMADAVAYACTALLYSVFEKHDSARLFMSYAMALCGGESFVKR